MNLGERGWAGGRPRRPKTIDPVLLLPLALPLILLLGVAVASAGSAAPGIAAALGGGFAAPLVRSTAAGLSAFLLSSVAAIAGGMLAVGPILSGRRSAARAICISLALCVTPLLVGPVSFAFLWGPAHLALVRLIMGDTVQSPWGVTLIDTLAQTLRYAPFEAWLLTIAALNTDPAKAVYANISGMNRWDFVRAELLATWVVILIVVGAFVFQDAVNDVILTYLALHPSPANGTELTGHVLDRVFSLMTTGISPRAAIASVLVLGIALGSSACACFAVSASLLPRLLGSSTSLSQRCLRGAAPFRGEAPTIVCVCCVVYLPLLWALLRRQPQLGKLLDELGLTLIAALPVAFVAWLAGTALMFRLRESAGLGRTRSRLAIAGLVAISVGFFPAIGTALAIYSLLFRLDPGQGEIGIWMAAQGVKLLPVLAIFCLPLVAELSERRLLYARVSGFRFDSRLWHEFLRPTALAQTAFVLIGWNWILNEPVISSVFQSDLPAFSELVLRSTSGRSAAYGVAAAMIAIEGALFGGLCLAWGESSYRGWQRRHAHHQI